MTAKEQVISLLRTASLSVEEALQWMPEDLTIGDNGVVEAVTRAENNLILALAKLTKDDTNV